MDFNQISKIESKSLVEQVSEQIKEAILGGVWAVNEKLPSEASLGKMFGVNRLTVRMALQTLSTIGLVDTRVGEGSFVKSFSFFDYLKMIDDVHLSGKKIDEVCDLRRLIEIESAHLAMDLAGSEEMDELHARLDRYLQLKEEYRKDEGKLDDFLESDLSFHYQICMMSHNSLFSDLFALTRAMIKEHIRNLVVRRHDAESKAGTLELTDQHSMIFDAIMAKDVNRCDEVYLDLLDYQSSSPALS